jgi:hypothetical protein
MPDTKKKYLHKDFRLHGLESACLNGSLEVVKFLVEKIGTKKPRGSWYYCFVNACSSGSLDVVKYLYDFMSSQGSRGTNELWISWDCALEYACRYGHLHIADFIFEKDPNCIKSHVIIYSCINNFIVAKWLFEHGAKQKYDYYNSYSYSNLEFEEMLYLTHHYNQDFINVFLETCTINYENHLKEHGLVLNAVFPRELIDICLNYLRPNITEDMD